MMVKTIQAFRCDGECGALHAVKDRVKVEVRFKGPDYDPGLSGVAVVGQYCPEDGAKIVEEVLEDGEGLEPLRRRRKTVEEPVV